MQIVDLRQLHSRSLEPLFREEADRWRDELQWDYRPSIDLVRKFIDSRALGGYQPFVDLSSEQHVVVERKRQLVGQTRGRRVVQRPIISEH